MYSSAAGAEQENDTQCVHPEVGLAYITTGLHFPLKNYFFAWGVWTPI